MGRRRRADRRVYERIAIKDAGGTIMCTQIVLEDEPVVWHPMYLAILDQGGYIERLPWYDARDVPAPDMTDWKTLAHTLYAALDVGSSEIEAYEKEHEAEVFTDDQWGRVNAALDEFEEYVPKPKPEVEEIDEDTASMMLSGAVGWRGE